MTEAKYGLVLEGGGAKGSYHIGAAKALTDLNIEIGGVSGTSIGALNGAMLIQGDLDKVYDLWHNIQPSKVYEIDDEYFRDLRDFNLNKNTLLYFFNKAKDIFEKKGIDNSKIKKILEDYIDEEKIRNSGKEFGIVTISVTDREPMELYLEDIPEGKLSDYLMASAYLPVFVKEKMDGKIFLDGGFYNNLPVGLLSEKGFKDIIAVRTHGIGLSPNLDDLDLNIIEINPSEELGLTLDFSKENARKNLNMGYYDTMRVFKDLKGNKYYFDFSKRENYYFNYLANLPEKDILKTGEIFNFRNMPPKRLLFEKIIPYITEMFAIDKSKDYKVVLASMMEVLLKNAQINRYHIYNLEEALSLIFDNLCDEKLERDNKLPNFIFSNKMLAKTISEKMKYKIILTLFKSKVTKN